MTHQIKVFTLFCLTSLLAGCSGGSSGSAQPSISIISPQSAILGSPTLFTLTGNSLTSGMHFALDQCAGVVEQGGGSSTTRQFSCTPIAQPGNYQGNVSVGDVPAKQLLNFTVNYQSAYLSISQNRQRVAVVKRDGSLWAWGNGEMSQYPQKVGDNFSSVSVSDDVAIATKNDGGLWGWGWSLTGVLGATDLNRLPIQIGTQFKKVAVGACGTLPTEISVSDCIIGRQYENAVGLKNDGSLWVWGFKSGLDKSTNIEYTPRQIGTGFVDIAVGASTRSFGIKLDGSLWTWTLNGNDESSDHLAPQKIGDGFLEISAGYNFAIGIKSGNTLWNLMNQAADPATGKTVTNFSPSLIATDIRTASAGYFYFLAIKTDGSLWVKGNNENGQLGNSTSNNAEQLIKVNVGVVSVSASDDCSIIQKTDGNLYAFGYCHFGDGRSDITAFPRKISGLN